MKLYVSGFDKQTTSEELRELFERFGEVIQATASPLGFAKVEMADAEAQLAIDALNGQPLRAAHLIVAEARYPEDGPFDGEDEEFYDEDEV